MQCVKAPCPPRVECVADDAGVSCANVRCAEGTTCVDTPDGPQCQPSPTCAAVTCLEGTICVEGPNGAECVHKEPGAICGDAICPQGEVCCNASCGICTPPGGSCIELACEPTCDAACNPGQHCELIEVQCFAPPCDPVPTCVDDTVYGCELIDCAPGHVCVEDAAGQGSCVPDDACATHQCGAGQHCELLFPPCAPPPDDKPVPSDYCKPIPTCVDNQTCAAATCPEGTDCDDSTGVVQCIPIDPCAHLDCANCRVISGQAVCGVPDECEDPCATVKCGVGTHCAAQQVVCVKEPCCPVAECVEDEPVYGCELIDCQIGYDCVEDASGKGKCIPASGGGVSCGKNTCAAGQVCCNASCGICTPPDGVCIQIACD